jgi:4-amino-4-deoxy-L-arabinose transferase-like glycosyltransferase
MPLPDSRWQSLPDRTHSIAWLIAGFTVLRLRWRPPRRCCPRRRITELEPAPDWCISTIPPATYSMVLTTALFGQSIFGIKSAAVLWALGWNLLWVRLILDMYGDRRLAFWSVAALNLTFVYEAFGLGPTPDSPLIFAWTGAIWAVWRLSQTGDGRGCFAAGGFVGLSMLGKYSGVLLGPVILLYLLTSPRQRHWFFKPQPYLAVLVAIAVFAPVLVWNAQHDWVSLAFQSSRRVGEMGGFAALFPDAGGHAVPVTTPYPVRGGDRPLIRGARGGLGYRWTTRVVTAQWRGADSGVHAGQLPFDCQDQLAGAGLLVADDPGRAICADA